MKRINILDQHTANKIAAGEVVERPSSVVKELVENSIDANSKNITIEIEEGGINLIKIIDDGDGIYHDDIETAFKPHATSKIKSVEDIYSISTLGFRGEALPSIAAVSKVIFKSKTNDSSYGTEICIEAGKVLSLEDVGMNQGSVMEVRDIFFNIPARKKFLKSISREGSLINDIVTRIALSNPGISIILINNGKKILHTYGTGNLKDVIRSIYGKNVYENIIEFQGEINDISVYGYIGKEEIAKGSRNSQSVFVNNRYIKNKTIIAAAENAFKSFSALNKFPFCIIFVNVPSGSVDVNIHPTKAEIKFNDDRSIFKIVFDSIHKAIKNTIFNSFAHNKVTETTVDSLEEEVEALSFSIPDTTNLNVNSEPIENERIPLDIKTVYSSISKEDIEKEEQLYQNLKTLGKENINNTVSDYNSDIGNNSNIIDNSKDTNINEPIANYSMGINQTKDIIKNSPVEKTSSNLVAKYPQLKVIGQFSKTYILAENGEDLYIVDQHAAHEKILFEKYLKNIQSRDIIIQPLLIPTIIDLSMDDFSYYEDNKDIFNNAGFTIEHFGGNTLSIKEVPYFLGKINTKAFFHEILEDLKKLGSGKPIDVKINKIATMACKAAIKANDYLNVVEMNNLLEELRFIEDPFHCPHGRPIILKFTEYELNKKFRRII